MKDKKTETSAAETVANTTAIQTLRREAALSSSAGVSGGSESDE